MVWRTNERLTRGNEIPKKRLQTVEGSCRREGFLAASCMVVRGGTFLLRGSRPAAREVVWAAVGDFFSERNVRFRGEERELLWGFFEES